MKLALAYQGEAAAIAAAHHVLGICFLLAGNGGGN